MDHNESIHVTLLNNIPDNESSEPGFKREIDQLVESAKREGNTPLHYAVKNGYNEIVKVLLTHYADFDITDSIFNTPLQIEQEIGNCIFEESKYDNSNLLKIVNYKDNDGKSLLNIAVSRKAYDIACELILHGSDISSINREHQKELLFKTTIITPTFIEDKKLRSVTGLLILKNPEALGEALGPPPRLCEDYHYPRFLSFYLYHGHIKVVDAILNSIPDADQRRRIVNYGDNSVWPLDRVNYTGATFGDDVHKKIVKYLFENGARKLANKADPIYSTLTTAAIKGHLETFKYFANQAKANDFNHYIGTACVYKQINIVEYIWKNFRQETTTYAGNTALHYTADVGREGLILSMKYLVENGADVNATNNKGQTPLHFSLYNGNVEVNYYLLSQGGYCHCLRPSCKYPINL